MAAERRRANGLFLFALGFYCAGMIFSPASPARASPWGQAPGDILVISSAEFFQSVKNPLNANTGSQFQRFESNSYFEIGLPYDALFGGKAVYGSSSFENEFGLKSAQGFSEIQLFGQKQIWRASAGAAAVKVGISRPASISSGARPEFQTDGIDLEFNSLYGTSFDVAGVTIFTVADAGLKKRFGAAADQLNFHTTIGMRTNFPVLILVETFSTISLRNEAAGGADFDIHKLQPSLVYSINPFWSIHAGLREEIAGRNLGLGRTIFLGVWSRF